MAQANTISNPPQDFISGLAAQFKEASQDFEEENSIPSNPFPNKVFSKAVQDIISHYVTAQGYPNDFICAAMLAATSIAIGGAFKVLAKGNYMTTAALWLVIVGRTGTMKSAPIKTAMAPIKARARGYNRKYKTEKQNYDNQLEALSVIKDPVERIQRIQAFKNENPEPKPRTVIVADITPEAFYEALGSNHKGTSYVVDEYASIIKNQNRYSKGAEAQAQLTIWDNGDLPLKRKGQQQADIISPFSTQFGGIQPEVVGDLFAGDLAMNGYGSRHLFAKPDSEIFVKWSQSTGDFDPLIDQQWANILNTLLDIKVPLNEYAEPSPHILKFTPAAWQVALEWQDRNAELKKKTSDPALLGIYNKLDTYLLRLSLILQLMHWASSEGERDCISEKNVRGAVELVEYFRQTALEVISSIFQVHPLDKLDRKHRELYDALPQSFEKKAGEAIAVTMPLRVPPRSFSRFLDNPGLFKKPSYGVYEKVY